jgi:hypothetical protein
MNTSKQTSISIIGIPEGRGEERRGEERRGEREKKCLERQGYLPKLHELQEGKR